MRNAIPTARGSHGRRRTASFLIATVAALAVTYGMTITPAQAQTTADLSVTDTNGVGVDAVVAGTSTTYTIELTNNSESEAVPGGIVVSTTFTTDGTEASTTSGGCEIAAGTMTCTTSDDLGQGAFIDFQLTLDVSPDFPPATDAISTTATITDHGPDNSDGNPGNDVATDTDDVTAEADLAVAVDASPSGEPPAEHAVAGATAEDYHVTVTNNDGPSTATGGYKATASIPDGTSFNADASDASCSVPDVVIVCDRTGIDPIEPNATDDFHVVLDLLPTIGDGAEPTDQTNVTFTVDINDFGTPQPAESTGNDEASADVTVYSESDLTIVKSASTPVGTPSNTIYANADDSQNTVVYHISVANNGVSDAHDVAINDSLNDNLLTNAIVCTGTSECPSGSPAYTGSFSIGTLATDTTADVTIVAHANATLGHSTANHPPPATTQDFRLPGPYTNQNTATVTGTPPHTAPLPPAPDPRRSSGPISTTIDTVPGKPVLVAATAGNQRVGLQWSAPPTGGQPILSYHVVATPCPSPVSPTGCEILTVNPPTPNAGSTFSYLFGPTSTPTPSFINVPLVNNRLYRFDIIATNIVGPSEPTSPLLTPNVSADTNQILNNIGSVDTGFAAGAFGCAPGIDPDDPQCKDVVGKWSLTDPKDNGSLVGLSAVPDAQYPYFAGGLPCLHVAFTAIPGPPLSTGGTIVDGGECVADKNTLSTFPTNQPNLTNPHLEYTQYDATVSTLALGAPCMKLVLNTNGDGTPKLASNGEPICADPAFPAVFGSGSTKTNMCPETTPSTGWTKSKPCAYIYYSVVQVPGYDITGARPVACTPTSPPGCDDPIIDGSSVQAGIKVKSGGNVIQLIRPWCSGKFPKFTFLPCVFKVNWLNNKTLSGNNDIQWQDYIVGDPGGKRTG